MKKNEYGRSLLELLAVLAIIAIIILSSLFLFNTLLTHYRRKDTVKQMDTLVTRYRGGRLMRRKNGHIVLKDIMPGAIDNQLAATDGGTFTLNDDGDTSFAVITNIDEFSCRDIVEEGNYDAVGCGDEADLPSVIDTLYIPSDAKAQLDVICDPEKYQYFIYNKDKATGMKCRYFYNGQCHDCPQGQKLATSPTTGETECCLEAKVNDCGYCGHCPSNLPCDPDSKVCVECENDGDCRKGGTPATGDRKYFCVDHQCEQCNYLRDGAQCDTQWWRPNIDWCDKGNSCEECDETCGLYKWTGTSCKETGLSLPGFGEECTEKCGCSGTLVCRYDNVAAKFLCIENPDTVCPDVLTEGEVCSGYSTYPNACCATGLTCDAGSGRCIVDPSKQCIPGIMAHLLPEGGDCSATVGYSPNSCCGEGLSCISGRCVRANGPCVPDVMAALLGNGDSCAAYTSYENSCCDAGLSCVEGTCQGCPSPLLGRGQVCSANTGLTNYCCQAGYVCDTTTGKCACEDTSAYQTACNGDCPCTGECMQCTDNQCECKERRIWNPDTGKCECPSDEPEPADMRCWTMVPFTPSSCTPACPTIKTYEPKPAGYSINDCSQCDGAGNVINKDDGTYVGECGKCLDGAPILASERVDSCHLCNETGWTLYNVTDGTVPTDSTNSQCCVSGALENSDYCCEIIDPYYPLWSGTACVECSLPYMWTGTDCICDPDPMINPIGYDPNTCECPEGTVEVVNNDFSKECREVCVPPMESAAVVYLVDKSGSLTTKINGTSIMQQAQNAVNETRIPQDIYYSFYVIENDTPKLSWGHRHDSSDAVSTAAGLSPSGNSSFSKPLGQIASNECKKGRKILLLIYTDGELNGSNTYTLKTVKDACPAGSEIYVMTWKDNHTGSIGDKTATQSGWAGYYDRRFDLSDFSSMNSAIANYMANNYCFEP